MPGDAFPPEPQSDGGPTPRELQLALDAASGFGESDALDGMPAEEVVRAEDNDPTEVIRELREKIVSLENRARAAEEECDRYFQTYGALEGSG